MQPAHDTRPGSRNPNARVGWIVACLAPLVFVLAMTVIAGGSEATAGAQAGEACTEVLEAGRDMAAGKRSPSSYLQAARAAEADARAAATEDRQYQSILEAIAAVRTAMEAGRPERAAPAAEFLASQCG